VLARRPLHLWLAAALSATAVAGCSDEARVGASATVQVALNEYRVTPQQILANAGTLNIVVHNDGRLTHDLVISQDGLTEASTQPIAPGQTADLQATLSHGQYLMASTILSDQALGAYGTLDVH